MKPIIALIIAVLFLSAGIPVRAVEPIVLRIGGAGGFHLPDKSDTAPRFRADRAIVEEFERAHPDIHLERAQGLQIGGPAAESSLLLQFAGGTAPDVIYVNFRQSATYVQQGFLRPLDSFIAQDPTVLKPINPLVLGVLRDVGKGHYYSLPYAQFVQALYYRKDLFSAAGLDPNRPPKNWDEFYDDARKLTDQTKGNWGFEFGNEPDASAYWWINFLWQAGGEIIKRNDKGQWVAAYDTPEGVTALEFYKKLMTAPWTGPDGKRYVGVARHSGTMSADRTKGNVAMWFQYQSNIIANTADVTALNPSLIGIAPLPSGPTGIIANEVNAAMWGISSQIKDPRVLDAAWQFVKFMGSDDADRIRTKAYVEAGLGNTVNPLSLQKYGYEDYTSPESKAWLEANKTLFQHGKPEPYGDNMSQIYVLLNMPLETIESSPNTDPAQLLARSAREVNAKLTGYVAPRVMRARRVTAWTVFGALLTGLLALVGLVVRNWYLKRGGNNRGQVVLRLVTADESDGADKSDLSDRSDELDVTDKARRPQPLSAHILPWLFMLPAVLSIFLWAYYPLARGLMMAFQDYRIVGGSHFVGLDNFIEVFNSQTFWIGLRNSLLFTCYTLVFGFFTPILLAVALSEIPKGKVFFRTLYYLPAVTSSIVIVFLWKWFEDGTPQGLFNTLISSALSITPWHSDPVKWLGDPRWALFAVVLPGIWASAGPGTIIYLAALQGIPDEMFEAADLDGAGIWTKFWRLTIPTLKPLILINLVGVTIGTFKAAETIMLMTGGGPANATHTIGLEIFYNAYLYLKFGYATAAAWIMGLLLVGFTVFQLRTMRNLRYAASRD